MFKLIHKFLSSVVFTKPSVHYLQPKSLNVYFKNAINPNYKLINLNRYDHFSIEMLQEKENDNHFFKVNLHAFIDNVDEIIELGKFETKTEALDALEVVKNKLFSPEKASVKLIYILTLLTFIVTFLLALNEARNVNQNPSLQFLQQLQQQQNALNAGQVPVIPNAGNQREAFEQLQAARQQANKVIEDGTRNNTVPASPVENVPSIEIPQDPAVKEFMGGLSK